MLGTGCALHQQRSCILVASIDLRCSIAAPPLKHSAADALVKVSRDLDHRRKTCPTPCKDDWQKVTCMSCEGVTSHFHAPTLEVDIKQVEVGHLADFRANSCNPKMWCDIQCPLMAVAATAQCSSLSGAPECRAAWQGRLDGVLNFSGITFFRCSSKLPAALAKAMLWTLVAPKEPTRLLSKGLVQRFSPRAHAGSLRLPSAVQKHG